MIKPRITHQELCEHIAATNSPTDEPLLLKNHSRFCAKKKTVIVRTLPGEFCWFIKTWNFMRYLCTNLTGTDNEKGTSDATCKKHCFKDFTNYF
jgi:hypothetical protein